MPFGVRIWCIITVVPRETLEPTTEQTDSLKVVVESAQKTEKDEKEPTGDSLSQVSTCVSCNSDFFWHNVHLYLVKKK